MEKKLGKVVIDGQLIDLDNMPMEKLEKLYEKTEKEEKAIREEIDRILNELR